MVLNKGIASTLQFLDIVLHNDPSELNCFSSFDITNMIALLTKFSRDYEASVKLNTEYEEQISEMMQNPLIDSAKKDLEIENLRVKISELNDEMAQKISDSAALVAEINSLRADMEVIEAKPKGPDAQTEEQLEQLRKKNQELQRTIIDLKSKPDFKNEISKLREENAIIKEQLEELQSQPNITDGLTREFETTFESLKSSNAKLEAELKARKDTIKSLTNEVQTLKAIPKFSVEEKSSLERRISDLNLQIATLSKGKQVMPIFKQTAKIMARKFVALKEIKLTSYLTDLADSVGINYNISINKDQGQLKALIIILDDLENECMLKEYARRQFAINKPVDWEKCKSAVLVTNYDYAGIQNIADLDNLDVLLVIDRYHRLQPAVKHEKAKMFYAIDSDNDVTTYDLKGEESLFYGVQDDRARKYKYSINPITLYQGINGSTDDIAALLTLNQFVSYELCGDDSSAAAYSQMTGERNG